jgi:hypothetical protein
LLSPSKPIDFQTTGRSPSSCSASCCRKEYMTFWSPRFLLIGVVAVAVAETDGTVVITGNVNNVNVNNGGMKNRHTSTKD